jgi:hypothetical protein
MSRAVDSSWLIHALVEGKSVTDSASDLLLAGANVWAANNIAFALLYWEIDGGGAAARAHGLPVTNATAFSPTDVMPLVPWAKISMAAQSIISLAILGLVIARAVDVFT